MSNAVNETAVHRAVLRGKPIELYGLTMWRLLCEPLLCILSLLCTLRIPLRFRFGGLNLFRFRSLFHYPAE